MVAVVQEVVVDPFEAEKKQLRRLKWLLALCIFLTIVFLVSSVAVVVYSGRLSMRAFEELPAYRVNRLLVDYRKAVAEFDDSIKSTRTLVEGEEGNTLLLQARQLPELVRQSEQDFAAMIQLYSEITTTIVSNTGGALEWNRHFQSQLKELTTASEQRREHLTAIVEYFPAPRNVDADTDSSDTDQSKKEAGASN